MYPYWDPKFKETRIRGFRNLTGVEGHGRDTLRVKYGFRVSGLEFGIVFKEIKDISAELT